MEAPIIGMGKTNQVNLNPDGSEKRGHSAMLLENPSKKKRAAIANMPVYDEIWAVGLLAGRKSKTK